MDPTGAVVRTILFAIFAGLTAILAAVIGPTYDNVLVPELSASSLYPPLPPIAGDGPSFLSVAASFSDYLLVNLVDPAIALVALGVGLLFLARATSLTIAGAPPTSLLSRLVVSVTLANFSIPVAGAVLGLAGAMYPVIAGFDGGAWQRWVNLAGVAALAFSWDNGALAFVVTLALFALVLMLTAAIALRDALLGVLLVLLPLLTLLWPFPAVGSLARKGWLLFAELSFLPCVLIVPLELAVGSPSAFFLLASLTAAAGAPALISVAGNQLGGLGFPSAASITGGGLQRGLAAGGLAAQGVVAPTPVRSLPGRAAGTVGPALRSLGRAALPAGLPLLTAEFLGRNAHRLFRHLPSAARSLVQRRDRFPGARAPSRGAGASTSAGRP